MNSGAKKVKRDKLLEHDKKKQLLKYINYAQTNGDKTILNYIALAAAILDPEQKKDMRNYLSKSMYDEKESKKRYEEIDKLREMGRYTEAEKTDKIKKIEQYNKNVLKEIKRLKKTIQTEKYAIKKTKIINKYAGTEEIFETLKSACDEYDLNYSSVKASFSMKKTNTIMFKGLIIEKL